MRENINASKMLLEKLSNDFAKLEFDDSSKTKIEMILSEIIGELNFTAQVSSLNEGLCQQIVELEKMNQCQRNELKSVLDDKFQLRDKLIVINAEMTSLREKNDELSRKSRVLESVSEATQKKSAKIMEENCGLTKAIADLKAALGSSKSVINNLKTQENILRQALRKSEDRLKGLGISEQDRESIIKSHKMSEQNLLHQISVLEKEKDSAKQEISKYQAELDIVLYHSASVNHSCSSNPNIKIS